jgi:hypothetical protein
MEFIYLINFSEDYQEQNHLPEQKQTHNKPIKIAMRFPKG